MQGTETLESAGRRRHRRGVRCIAPVDEERDEAVGRRLEAECESPVEAAPARKIAAHRHDRAGVEPALASVACGGIEIRGARRPGDQTRGPELVEPERAWAGGIGTARIGGDQLDVDLPAEWEDGIPAAECGVPAAVQRQGAEARFEVGDCDFEVRDRIDEMVEDENESISPDS